MRKVAPISSIVALVAILGFLISAVYIGPMFSETWAFAFMLIFAILFVASMISAVKAPIEELDTIAFEKKKRK